MAKKKQKKSTEDEEESKGKSKPMMFGVLLVGGLAVYKFVLAPTPAPADASVTEEDVVAVEEAPEEGEIFALNEIVVNLADTDASRYLRIGLALVLERGVSSANMPTESAKATDAAIEYLSSLSYADLQKPGSKTEVRSELSSRIRAAFDDSTVVRVLLTTFVMQ